MRAAAALISACETGVPSTAGVDRRSKMALRGTPLGYSTQPHFATGLPSADCYQSARRLPPVTSLIIRWQKTRSEHKKKISETSGKRTVTRNGKEQTLKAARLSLPNHYGRAFPARPAKARLLSLELAFELAFLPVGFTGCAVVSGKQ